MPRKAARPAPTRVAAAALFAALTLGLLPSGAAASVKTLDTLNAGKLTISGDRGDTVHEQIDDARGIAGRVVEGGRVADLEALAAPEDAQLLRHV